MSTQPHYFYKEFENSASAVWTTQTAHDSGDTTYEGEFRKQIARKNLETMLEPPASHQSAA